MKKRLIISSLAILIAFMPYISSAKTADDSYISEQDYLGHIKAFSAWNYTTGSNDIVVAVIDTGVDVDHPDLYENIWQNKNEIPGDLIDNDNNGYVDDIHGWDFIHNEADPKPKINDEYSKLGIEHGTLVAGVIGAIGNNDFGIAGLNWQVSIMPLVALDGEGNGNLTNVARAIDYAVVNGADVINMSLVGSVTNNIIETAIKHAHQAGVVVVAAVGNEEVGEDLNQDYGVDLTEQRRYPVCIDGTNNYILGVGSVDANDKKSLFSNYGTDCIDIIAPGENFFGLLMHEPSLPSLRQKFGGYWSGTSLATPLVAGAAALLKSYRPLLTNVDIYNLIMQSAYNIDDKNNEFKDKLGSGRLDLEKLFTEAEKYVSHTKFIAVAKNKNSQGEVKTFSTSGELISQWQAFSDYNEGLNMVAADFDDDSQSELAIIKDTADKVHIKIYSTNGVLQSEIFDDSLPVGNYNLSYINNRLLVWNQSQPDQVFMYAVSGERLTTITVPKIDYLLSGDMDSDNYNEILVLSNNDIYLYNQLGNLEAAVKAPAGFDQLAIKQGQVAFASEANSLPTLKIISSDGEINEYAYTENYQFGLNLSANDDYIVTGIRENGGPHLKIFDWQGELVNEFFVFEHDYYDGFTVTTSN